MSNVIAIIWDFDKTLIQGYMQTPMFKHYNIDPEVFWKEVSELPDRYSKEQGVTVNRETIYLNHILHYVRSGKMPDLTNEKLRSFGAELVFYQGIPDIFSRTKKLVEDNPAFAEHNIRVEHYIVSTGLKSVIDGSIVAEHATAIWGCELIEDEVNSQRALSEIVYTIDNTSKTRALFEINKGIPQHPDIHVNDKMDSRFKRVDFHNMLYIADGPSDIPAFSVINHKGGSTFAVYPAGDDAAFRQVENLRRTGRVSMYAEADYRKDTTADMWIRNRILELAQNMVDHAHRALSSAVSDAPVHLS